jgi:protein-arginine kinase activator protein McsA
LIKQIAEILSLNHGVIKLWAECVMGKMETCDSCGEKLAEYVLDDRHLCVECYKREEKKAGIEQTITQLAA